MGLSNRQRRFVGEYMVDSNAAGAAKRAGYSARSARVNGPRLLSNAAVRAALEDAQRAVTERLELDRQAVLEGLRAAIATAKSQGNAAAQIAGWREIGKMMGYYAPEVQRVALSTDYSKEAARMEAMSDEELLAIVSQRR